VRIVHKPSGIVVHVRQNEAGRNGNSPQDAEAKLYEIEQDKKRAEIDGNTARKGMSRGSQIRSYVFQPYQMVKITAPVRRRATCRCHGWRH